jgi:hypothetical protein
MLRIKVIILLIVSVVRSSGLTKTRRSIWTHYSAAIAFCRTFFYSVLPYACDAAIVLEIPLPLVLVLVLVLVLLLTLIPVDLLILNVLQIRVIGTYLVVPR